MFPLPQGSFLYKYAHTPYDGRGHTPPFNLLVSGFQLETSVYPIFVRLVRQPRRGEPTAGGRTGLLPS